MIRELAFQTHVFLTKRRNAASSERAHIPDAHCRLVASGCAVLFHFGCSKHNITDLSEWWKVRIICLSTFILQQISSLLIFRKTSLPFSSASWPLNAVSASFFASFRFKGSASFVSGMIRPRWFAVCCSNVSDDSCSLYSGEHPRACGCSSPGQWHILPMIHGTIGFADVSRDWKVDQ